MSLLIKIRLIAGSFFFIEFIKYTWYTKFACKRWSHRLSVKLSFYQHLQWGHLSNCTFPFVHQWSFCRRLFFSGRQRLQRNWWLACSHWTCPLLRVRSSVLHWNVARWEVASGAVAPLRRVTWKGTRSERTHQLRRSSMLVKDSVLVKLYT